MTGPAPTNAAARRRARRLAGLGYGVLRVLEATLRWEVDPTTRARLRAVDAGGPFIMALWHNRILVMPFVWRRHLRSGHPRGSVLTSLSPDGEVLTQFAARFGLEAVRGSAARRGAAGLRELAARLRAGQSACVTPDGSRGPVYRIKPGLVRLAQLSGAPVVPFHLEFSRAWRLRSWDRFWIPRPFARVTLTIGEPLRFAPTATEAEFAAACEKCERAMLALVRRP